MSSETGVVENLLHLALFIGAAGVIGVVAVAVLERLAGSVTPFVRRRHIAAAIGIFVALVAAEELHHHVGG
jgi:hypothetical protein